MIADVSNEITADFNLCVQKIETSATSYWLFKVVISSQLLTNQHVFTKILQA